MEERIGNLLLEHIVPSTRQHDYPILCIPGMHSGAWLWKNLLRATANAGWDSWALNLRGHWGSRPVPNIGSVSIHDYAQDVQDVLDKIGPAVLVGHSMGGLITQVVAASNHVRIPAFVLVSSVPPRGILAARCPSISRYWKFRYLYASLFGKPLRPHEEDMLALVLNKMSSTEASAIFPKFVPDSGLALREISLGLVGINPEKVRCPVLVVGASEDKLLPPGIQRKIARKYGAEYLEFSGHGHALMLEQGWEKPIHQILAWLKIHVSDPVPPAIQ